MVGPSNAASRRFLWIVLTICLFGFLLRLWNIGFGLPLEMHADEPNKVRVVERYLRGENPNYFLHPGLLVNTTALFTWVLSWFGGGTSPASIILNGRILSAIAGALTIIPTAFLGAALFGRRVGLFAAAAIALAPIHVVHSRYLKEDVYLTLAMMVCLYGLVQWIRLGANASARKYFVIAIIGAGFSFASKFIGVVMIVILAYACLSCIEDEKKQWPAVFKVLFFSAVIFLVCSPQIFMDFEAVKRDVSFEVAHGIRNPDKPSLHIWQWPDLGVFYFYHAIGWGMSWPLALAAVGGIFTGFKRRVDHRALWPLLLVGILWYVVSELTPAKRGTDIERYILPCIPIWSILGGAFLLQWAPAFQSRWNVSYRFWNLAALMILALCLIYSIGVTYQSVPDTRILAGKWLAEHGPKEPYQLAYCDDDFKQLDVTQIPLAQVLKVSYTAKKAEQSMVLDQAEVFTLSSFYTDRYEKFPHLDGSRKSLKRIRWMREQFPYGYKISKSSWWKVGFHNPDIEIRFRKPLPETAAKQAGVKALAPVMPAAKP